MTKNEKFSDQVHIEKIRELLWRGREFGQAAVMVGAGFSRNADRISNQIPSFPLWEDLGKHIYDSLYPLGNLSNQDRESLRNKAITGVGTLKLASEYEALFSRQFLDKFIIDSIPDNNYHPAKLHELLLSLPWSDVFTTNFDTLLERTLPKIHERKYDIILTTSDIPGRMKPRIIKLHGSFPSNGPFIITEEDYRTYPTKSAPFMNMVQQSLMENIFCLIGFSGDDPNFLYWSGWVRDNLGKATPPIYLCGILNLSLSQRRVLESRNIIPIDLSSLFSEMEWPNHEIRNSKAIEWFLLNLMRGAPPYVMRWPTPSSTNIWEASDGLPDVPQGPRQFFEQGRLFPDHDELPLKVENLRKQYEIWRQKRLEYPGWIVAPKENREELWAYTEGWISPVLDSIENLTQPEKIFLLYELNWRLEKSLIPFDTNWVEKMIPIIEAFNPYPRLIELESAILRPDKEEFKKLDWKQISEQWGELVFAIIRNAREDQNEERFHLWMSRMEKVVKLQIEWQSRYFYEKCLFYLFNFDQEKVRKTLDIWPERKDMPWDEAKRASILTELGELKEAEKILEEALAVIRSRIQISILDYSLLSQEGWVMILLQAIKNNSWPNKRNFVLQYRDRWEKLGVYKCNPWYEIEMSKLLLKGPCLSTIPKTIIKNEFDPGIKTETHKFPVGLINSDLMPAFSFLRMLEDGDIPFSCGMVSMFSDVISNAAQCIFPFAPNQALSSMVRAREYDKIKAWFNRTRIASLTEKEVIKFNNLFDNSLTQSMRYLAKYSNLTNSTESLFSRNQLIISIEIVSRLCFRLSFEQLDKLFNLAITIYSFPVFRQYYDMSYCVQSLFKRLLMALPQEYILKRMVDLLTLPIPTENGFEVHEPKFWGEPFNDVKWQKSTKLSGDYERSEWSVPITNLISVVKNGKPEARKRAILRLGRLHEINLLTNEEKKNFAEALWAKIDTKKGIPADTDLLDLPLLFLPELSEGIIKNSFKRYLLSSDFTYAVQYTSDSNGKQHITKSLNFPSANIKYIIECKRSTLPLLLEREDELQRYIDWSSDEAIVLLKKIVAWWDNDKEALKENSQTFTDSLRKEFSKLVSLLAEIILPRMVGVEEKIRSLIERILPEMEEYGICILSALPMTLFIKPDSYGEVSQRLRNGLNSIKQEEVEDSIDGLFYWLIYGNKGVLAAPPQDLLNELINRIVTRRQPGLNYEIQVISAIIYYYPNYFKDDQFDSICTALKYLYKETELPNKQDMEAADNIYMPIPQEDIPEFRRNASELAYVIYDCFFNNNKIIPDILVQWKERSQKDPLPEVKRIWSYFA